MNLQWSQTWHASRTENSYSAVTFGRVRLSAWLDWMNRHVQKRRMKKWGDSDTPKGSATFLLLSKNNKKNVTIGIETILACFSRDRWRGGFRGCFTFTLPALARGDSVGFCQPPYIQLVICLIAFLLVPCETVWITLLDGQLLSSVAHIQPNLGASPFCSHKRQGAFLCKARYLFRLQKLFCRHPKGALNGSHWGPYRRQWAQPGASVSGQPCFRIYGILSMTLFFRCLVSSQSIQSKRSLGFLESVAVQNWSSKWSWMAFDDPRLVAESFWCG